MVNVSPPFRAEEPIPGNCLWSHSPKGFEKHPRNKCTHQMHTCT